MGMAYLYFPEGINPHNEKKLIIMLELLRGVFLETIQRKSTKTDESEDTKNETENTQGGKVLNLFSGIFGKKKTG